MDRRSFLTTSSALLSYAALPAWAATPPRLLILIELRGGNDGLNTVIPIDDGAYFDLRPRLAFKPDAVVRFEVRPHCIRRSRRSNPYGVMARWQSCRVSDIRSPTCRTSGRSKSGTPRPIANSFCKLDG